MNKVYNPGSIDPAMKYDPLELFKASTSDVTLSRYSILFKPDVAECEIVRRLCFNSVLYNSHESKRGLLPALLTTFAGDVPCMEDIKIAIGNRFSCPESAPYPSTCTRQRALELFNLRFQEKMGQLSNPVLQRTVRRDIARCKTILNEKLQQDAAAKTAE